MRKLPAALQIMLFVNNREQFNFLIEESLNFRSAEIDASGV